LTFVTKEVLKLQLVFVWKLLDVEVGGGRAGEKIHDIGRESKTSARYKRLIDWDE